MAVKFDDYSFQVKAALNDTTKAWLRTWANEIAAQAKRGVTMDDDTGTQLRKSYSSVVDDANGVAQIGSPLESAYWEEFGTGSHADTIKNGGIQGRPMWWVYVKNETPRTTKPVYRTEDNAKAVAAGLREKGKDAYASNGREPNYTLEKAFKTTKPRAIADLERRLKGLD